MTKRTFIIAGLIAFSISGVKVAAQETESIKLERDYNTRDIYLRIGYGIGGGDWATRGMGIGLYAKILPSLYTGITGFYYGDTGGKAKIQQIIPLSLDVQYEIGTTEKGNGAIFVASSIGYNFVLNKSYFDEQHSTNGLVKNGLYFNPSLGYRLNFSRNTGIVFDLGYQLAQGKGVDLDSKMFLQNHVQHNILFKASLFF